MNAQPSGGLPGLTHFDHIGFTVPDLEQATRFLVDVLGYEYLYSLGPYSPDGSWMSAHLNVGDASEIPEIRFFRCAGLPVFEVFEYRSPDQQLRPPRNSDVGGHHVALHVQDIDAAIDYLRERGVQVLGQPTASKGPHLGQRWVYFLFAMGNAIRTCLLSARAGVLPGGGSAARGDSNNDRRLPSDRSRPCRLRRSI